MLNAISDQTYDTTSINYPTKYIIKLVFQTINLIFLSRFVGMNFLLGTFVWKFGGGLIFIIILLIL